MSTLVSAMAAECSREIADPEYDRVDQGDWLQFANRIARELCVRYRLYETEATGDLYTDERYPYPNDLVLLRRVRWTPTPADSTTFRRLKEKFEDEMERMADYQYPSGDPSYYWARRGWFELDSIPAATVVGGLRITYFAIPADVTDYLAGLWPLPDFTRNHAQEGMKILAKWKLRHYAEAERDWTRWVEGAHFVADPMEDRSDDRRTAFRPASLEQMFDGMV